MREEERAENERRRFRKAGDSFIVKQVGANTSPMFNWFP